MIVCLELPNFAITRYRQAHPEFCDASLILMDYRSGKGQVYAASVPTIEAGMTASRALALCGDAQLVRAEPEADVRWLNAVLERLSIYARRLEAVKLTDGQTATVYLDPGKLRPSDVVQIVGQIQSLLERYFGLWAQVGVAGERFTAHIASLYADIGKMKLVTPRESRDFLASLPVGLLPLTKEMARRLPLLGIRTMGQLATLPSSAIFAQFGRMGQFNHKLSRGEDTRRIATYVPEKRECLSLEFDGAVTNRLVLETALCEIAKTLAGRLNDSGYTTREVELTASLDDYTERTATTQQARPIHSVERLNLALVRLLGELDIRCGVTGLQVELSALKPLIPTQLSLFDYVSSSRSLDDVLVNLIFRYGTEHFLRAVPSTQPSPLPETRIFLEPIESAGA
ncbi:MAG: hypothetical protein RLP44_01540 [Aggregatilineales bacterium]